MRSQNFSNTVKEIINKTQTKRDTIEFEITESVLIKYTDYNLKLINELKDAGIKFALDDFGTEYSSLNYLKLLPISTLKIDKSFVDQLKNSIVERAINSNIINLAHSLNLSVVAEGVEEGEQVEILKDMNCDEIQGFYYSKPLPAAEAEKLLSAQKTFLT
jgi:EAL domain-containing protein (putative c-di-GMP-specific phosphodiesterase class I)